MFDPLHKWLGIPPAEQPPNDYRLLGVANFEDDPEVIDAAADKHLSYLHNLTNGEYAEEAEELSNRVSAARLRLLSAKKKAAYDEELKRELDVAREPAAVDYGAERTVVFDPAEEQPVDELASVFGTPAEESPPPMPVAAASPAPVAASPTSTPRAAKPIADNPPDLPSPTIKKRSVRVRKSGGSSRVSKAIWITSLPGAVVLGVLIYAIANGWIALDQKKLERIGVPPEQAEKLAAISEEDEVEIPEVVPLPPSSSGAASTDRPNAQPVRPPNPSTANVYTPTRPSVSPATEPPRVNRSTPAPTLLSTATPDDRLPLPSPDEIAEKMDVVRDLYEQPYRDATSQSARIKVASEIQQVADQTFDDPPGQFALYRVAYDIYRGEDEFEAAIQIADRLDELYQDVDVISLKRDVLSAVKNANDRATLYAKASIDLAGQMLQQGRVTEGLSLCSTMKTKLRRIPASTMDQLRSVQEYLKEGHELFQRYEKSALVLEQNPDDAAAQTDAGKYFCLVENRWTDGLPRLARGADKAYQLAASRELDETRSISLETADAWYDVYEQAMTPLEKRRTAARAKWFYLAVRPTVQGIEVRKVNLRIEELNGIAPTDSLEDTLTGLPATARLNRPGRKATLLRTLTFQSPQHPTDFAIARYHTAQIGMGDNPGGLGEAAAGFELRDADVVRVTGTSTHAKVSNYSGASKSGFLIDYHTAQGYSKRVFLNCGMNYPGIYSNNPPWGTATQPAEKIPMTVSNEYIIELDKYAPTDWDGRCWFTVYMMHTGSKRALRCTLEWSNKTN